MGWVDEIGKLYHLNSVRVAAPQPSAAWTDGDQALRLAVHAMSKRRDSALADILLAEPAAKVLRSMHEHWPGLTVFVDHPWVPMDNNVAERDARQAVVGRKNFYGSGSLWSGQLAATMYSLLMTLRLCKLNPRTWLSQYLQACADNGNQALSQPQLDAFLPWAMDAARLQTMRAAVHATVVRDATQGWDTS